MRIPSRARSPEADTVSPVARCAAGILEAWESGDKQQLAAELAVAAGMDAKPPPGGLERERTELLVAIAADLRAMLAFTRTKGAAVPLRLLQHLTASP